MQFAAVAAEEILAWIGRVVAYGGGGVAMAALAFRVFGERWLESKFATQLEAFKADQVKEVERLKYRISQALNRVNKLHEREFEVLSEVWDLLQQSMRQVGPFLSPLQVHPQFGQMPRNRLELWVANSPLDDVDKTGMLKASDPQEYYNSRMFWYELNRTKATCNKFRQCLDRNSIFLDPDLKQRFAEIDDVLYKAVVAREISQMSGGQAKRGEAWDSFEAKVKPLVVSMESELATRLRKQGLD